jgi:hypothetical protein
MVAEPFFSVPAAVTPMT